MIFGTWNVQGIRGKLVEVEKVMKQGKVDIVALTETKKKGNGIEQVGDYIHVYSGVPKSNRASKGVSLLIKKELKHKLTDWEAVNERIISANFNLKGHRTTVIGVYAPNEDATVLEKDQFQEQLEDVLVRVGNQREVILLGDFNARTGRKKNDKVIGEYGEEVLNNNGQRLIQFCEQQSLKILNGFYPHRDIHKYTWRQQTRGLRSIIDYVIVKQNIRWKVRDVRAYRGADCGSDHYLIKAQVFIPFKNDREQNEAQLQGDKLEEVRYNLDGFYHQSTKTLYQSRLDQKLNESFLEDTPNALYEHIVKTLHTAAKEALGERKNTNSHNAQLTWNDEMEQQKRIKQHAYNRMLNSNDINDNISYKRERAKFKRMVIQNKDETWERKCQEIESHIGGARSSESWKLIKELRRESANKINLNPIKLERWKEYFEQELNEDREQYLTHSPTNYTIQGQHIQVKEEMVWKALKSMRNKKAAGPEGIPAELLKNGTEKLVKMLRHLFEKFINGAAIPEVWKEAWITPIHKKGVKSECQNYRCISVTSTFSRIYGKILRKIIEDEYDPYDIEQQSGFRAGRSCVDNIFSINQINEKKTATNREVHLLFVDLTRAYDTVPIKKLWQVLEMSPINSTAISAIKQLYGQSYSRVKLGKSLSPTFTVTKGLRQGCCLSTTLFKIYLNEALKRWRRSCHGMGIQLTDDTALYTLHFADDQVVIAQDKEDLEFMSRRLFEEYQNWGLTVNLRKTKYMCVGGEKEKLMVNDDVEIDACDEYIYLGTKITADGRTQNEIESRINKGKTTIRHLNSILWSKSISAEKKRYIYSSVFKSIVLYGSETWQLTKSLEKRLLALEMDFWRRSARVSRMDRMRNERVRELMKVEKTIIEDTQQKQLIWYGHVERMSDQRIPKLALKWVPRERKKRGRPKVTWMSGIQKAMSERNLRPGEWEDRRGWRLGTGRRRTL
ncbi:uncharacterized protein LOC123307480 [Coccinella septempunctata]|uniref:uncharacterized protein LOC123307480 n=1 Tax=Coccinella septempunctata TaxID=41139 RepID=UPI001D09075B|nr:uncharacterized protein LOC123307480 [Coccinella septempunctata]